MQYIGEKADGALTRLIPNIRVPNPFKKRMLSRIVTSIIYIVCLPDMVGGILHENDEKETVLGVSSKRDYIDKWLQDSV